MQSFIILTPLDSTLSLEKEVLGKTSDASPDEFAFHKLSENWLMEKVSSLLLSFSLLCSRLITVVSRSVNDFSIDSKFLEVEAGILLIGVMALREQY
jgi:hypothetical protein